MNSRKICFITCVNNKQLYREALYYINQLEVPEGYEVECISIENVQSMTKGYNEGMKASDAKYKVYMHQDVYILNKFFIKEVLQMFNDNDKIGMLGVAGAKIIPTNGVWWESQHKYGKVYDSHTGQMKLLSFSEVKNEYEKVQVIDGLIMVTQYDISWREDIFDGWHFYDISHSIEFIKQGYEVIIPRQEQPWIMHDCGIVNIQNKYEHYRKVFLEEYSKDIFPLVSILIPTYNRPHYFQLALESVLQQSYKNIEIIVGDDSTNNETKKLVKHQYINKYSNIKYYHNEKNLGQFDNDLKLLDMAEGEFINYLMDDDLFELTKIEKMMNYFIQDKKEEISLVTSHRQMIDDNGNKKEIFGETDKLFTQDIILDGITLGEFMLSTNLNFIGEPTTVLFRKNKLLEPFGVFNRRRYGCNVDQASWLNLLSQHKGVYINEVLSYYRVHKGQQQHDIRIRIKGFADYVHEILTCREKGFLLEEEKYIKAMEKCLALCENYIIKPLKGECLDIPEYREFEKYYNQLKEKLDGVLLIINENNKKLPLVSILIPAYNQTKYLKKALESAINQTYPNIEIIIGDDSTNDEVKRFIEPYLIQYKNIIYFKNIKEEADYGYKNHISCLEKSKGEYVNYLNHDDLFHPEKIEYMMRYFLENPNLVLATSVRGPIDIDGKKTSLNDAFLRLYEKDTIVKGYDLSRKVIKNLLNVIGEPTTVLFKKKYIDENKYGYFNKTRFKSISDVANWFTLLQYGDAVYISKTLSYFRVHPEQNSNKPTIHIEGVIAWQKLIKHSYDTGILQNVKEYKQVLDKWLRTFIPIINIFIQNNNYVEKELRYKLSNVYNETIDEIMHKDTLHNFECPICNESIERFLPYQYKKHKTHLTSKFHIIGSDTDNFSCPNCYCHDRERHLVMYFNREKIWEKQIINKKVLHIAPEIHIQQIISKIETKEYICGDLYPSHDFIKKLDITDLLYKDNYFDFIICNHVLEHIIDDLKAMSELYRVLKKGGYAVLQTPYSPIIEKSFEDNNIQTDNERLKFYGQVDHVRVYGLDFFQRLKSVGFTLNIIKNYELFTREECEKYGVNYQEDLILVRK